MAAHTIEERKQAIYDTLHSIHADGKPGDYDTNRLLNLITVTDAVATLCWNIESATKLPKPLLRTSLTAPPSASQNLTTCAMATTVPAQQSSPTTQNPTSTGALQSEA